MIHITHEGEPTKQGINVGWGEMGLRIIFRTRSECPTTDYYFRIRKRIPVHDPRRFILRRIRHYGHWDGILRR